MTNHHNVRKNILELVQAFPHLTENYNELTYYYWTVYDNVKNLSEISRATPAETIRRNFQKLAELRLIEVPRRVMKARKEKEREFRHEFKALA